MRMEFEPHFFATGATPLGRIEVICGGMFSGKSEELIRRLRRAVRARARVQAFKPAIDDRYGGVEVISSHSEMQYRALAVRSSEEMAAALDPRAEVVGIDEVQFFDDSVVDFCDRLANMGRRVIVAGLDQDYRGKPFPPVPHLMAIAEYITKLTAVCTRCGAPAHHSQRLVPSNEKVVVGAADSYEARCRRCFEPDLGRQIPIDLVGNRNQFARDTPQPQPSLLEDQ